MARLALAIGNGRFAAADAFPVLRTPRNDAGDIAAVLERHGGFERVDLLLDADADAMRGAIEDLYGSAGRGDLTVLFYSGHGYKDRRGRHYLVARDTRTERLLSSGVQESFIHDAMEHSASRHRVVILDCCFSGAFIKGKKSGAEPLLLEGLRGEATALLASSGSIQYSFEEEGRNSLFTRFLLEGIEEGLADEDEDRHIGVDELFAYADARVREWRPEQTPMLEHRARDSRIILTENPKPKIRPAELPSDLLEAMRSPNATARLGAVHRLGGMLRRDDEALRLAAAQGLEAARDDDSREVSAAARTYLTSPPTGSTRPPPRGTATRGSSGTAPTTERPGDESEPAPPPASAAPATPRRWRRWSRPAAVVLVLIAVLLFLDYLGELMLYGPYAEPVGFWAGVGVLVAAAILWRRGRAKR